MFSRRGTGALCLGVFLGLLWPSLAEATRPLLAPVVGGLLYFSLLAVDWQAVKAHLQRPFLIGLALLWLLFVSALASSLLFSAVSAPLALENAIVLMACAPPILGSTAIALLLRLDSALTLVLSVLATLLAPLTIPPAALLLLGIDLQIGFWDLMGRLILLVALPTVLAFLTRRHFGSERLKACKEQFNGMLVLLMLVFAVAIMAEAAQPMRTAPGHVLDWILAAFLANIGLQVLAIAVFFWRGRRWALTLGLMTGNTNMGLLLASLPASSDPDVLLYFALAQLPMYILPALQKPLYRRLIEES